MATSTAIPTVRRLCALASPLPLGPAVQLVKNSQFADTWNEPAIESYDGGIEELTSRRNGVKRQRKGEEYGEQIKSKQPSMTRPHTPTTTSLDHNSSTSLDHSSREARVDSSSARSTSQVSPTPRSAPRRAPQHAPMAPILRLRTITLRNYPPIPSTRQNRSSYRLLSSSSSQSKPALAYHDLLSNVLDSAVSTVTKETPALRSTSTIANPTSEGPKLTNEENAILSHPKPRGSSQLPPRPPSPYGEINSLIRHPLLYDPILKPRHPIVLCHGTLFSPNACRVSLTNAVSRQDYTALMLEGPGSFDCIIGETS